MTNIILIIFICIVFLVLLLSIYLSIYRKKRINNVQHNFPKIIFQTWKSKKLMPDNMTYWHNSWINYNKDFNMILWDDDDNRAFIEKYYPWFLDIYDNYPETIMRVDAVRYFFLYTYGGIYADLDFECLKSLNPLLNDNNEADIILGKMDVNNDNKEHDIPNAIMISKPKQLFWVYVFNELMKNSKIKNESVEFYTGPIMLKNAYLNFKSKTNKEEVNDMILQYNLNCTNDSNIKIMGSEVLYPLSWSTKQDDRIKFLNTDYNKLTEHVKHKYPNAYTITYWTHTW